jgi:hypothetical protein
MPVYSCPKGHSSSEPDFCSECGAKIQGADPASAPASATLSCAPCPDCGAPRTDTSSNFCEICGYNFSTGVHGNVPVAAVAPQPKQWTVVVAVDPSLREPDGPEPPADVAPITVALDKPANLIGRKSEKRAIIPEVSLDFDDGVSHRHALLTWGDGGLLTLRDIGSANGTRLNGADVQPLLDIALHDGDQITLGRWTRLTVRTV